MADLRKENTDMHKIIPVTIRDKIATKTGDEVYICGNSDFVIEFDFDAEWDAFETKTARFEWNGGHQDVIFSGSTCSVPIISDTHRFHVGVYAGNLRTTTAAYVPSRKSILCGSGIPHAPQPDVYAQIMDAVNSRPSMEQTQKAIDQAMDAEFFIIRVNGGVPSATEKEIDAVANSLANKMIFLEEDGHVYTYVGKMESIFDSETLVPTFFGYIEEEDNAIRLFGVQYKPENDEIITFRKIVKTPNPYKMKLTGAVNAEYDGSKQVNVEIPTIAGPVGPAGADGFNPEVRLERTEDGVKITAVNKDGEESQTVFDGADTEFFLVKIIDNAPDHSEEEIRAAVEEGKICVALDQLGGVYTYVGTMPLVNDTTRRVPTFYEPLLYSPSRCDIRYLQIDGNKSYNWFRDDARIANPRKLTFTGAVNAEYDGSQAITVRIPTGGSGGGGVDFDVDENTLTLKDGILSVNTTDKMEADNTQPITSAGVYTQVGNINALLATI